MTHWQVKTASGEVLTLAPHPLGEGAEGKVYEVFAPLEKQNKVVKIFHPEQLNKEKHLKINYLKENKPAIMNTVWVEELIYKDDKFVGFLMPKATSEFDLSHLCNLLISPRLPSVWHLKFARDKVENLQFRALICQNLAKIVHQIHQSQKYVIADLKPENIRVNLNAEVSLLDIDSIEVFENERVIFKPYKITPEYCPPELKQITIGETSLSPDWDNFALAIIFYKILLGLHPYAVSAKTRMSEMNTFEQKIQADLFPFGKQKEQIEFVPPAHQNFWALPGNIQDLFHRAFSPQNQALMRPSAQEWEKAFQKFQPNRQKYTNPVPVKPESNPPILKKTSAWNRLEKMDMSVIAFIIIIIAFNFIFFNASQLHIQPPDRLARTNEEQALLLAISEKEILVNDLKKARGLVCYAKFQFEPIQKEGYLLKFVIESPKYEKGTIEYETISDPYYGIRIYKRDGYYGLMNENAVEITANIYNYLGSYSDEGLILAKKDGLYGYISALGKTIIPFQYDRAKPFINGFAEVRLDDKWVKIDKLGNIVLDE
jgi:serine/threonine protein kinase